MMVIQITPDSITILKKKKKSKTQIIRIWKKSNSDAVLVEKYVQPL